MAPGHLPPLAIMTASEVAVYRALTYAGRRLLRDTPRSERGVLQEVPPHELHIHLPLRPGALDVYRCVDAWQALDAVVRNRLDVITACEDYVRELLRQRLPHSSDYLRTALCQIGECA